MYIRGRGDCCSKATSVSLLTSHGANQLTSAVQGQETCCLQQNCSCLEVPCSAATQQASAAWGQCGCCRRAHGTIARRPQRLLLCRIGLCVCSQLAAAHFSTARGAAPAATKQNLHPSLADSLPHSCPTMPLIWRTRQQAASSKAVAFRSASLDARSLSTKTSVSYSILTSWAQPPSAHGATCINWPGHIFETECRPS